MIHFACLGRIQFFICVKTTSILHFIQAWRKVCERLAILAKHECFKIAVLAQRWVLLADPPRPSCLNKRNNHTTQRSQTCSDTGLERDRLQLQIARIRTFELVQELIFRIFLIVDGFEVLEMLQRKLHDQSASCIQQTISLLFVLAKSQVRGLRGSEFWDEQRDDSRLMLSFCILHQRRFSIRSSLRPIQ